jgi:DnaJ-class molecular chaperone
MKPKNYYDILGVAEGAGIDEIKKAYRRLAKQCHPDANQGNRQAEDRFKDVSEAYDILSDPKKRQQYDTLRKYGGGPGGPSGTGADFRDFDFRGFRPPRGEGRSFTFEGGDGFRFFGGFGDLFSKLFDFEGETGEGRTSEAATEIRIPFELAATGGRTTIRLAGAGEPVTLSVAIPAGIEDGGRIRLKGQGPPSRLSGAKGDLILTVRVEPHRFFKRKGQDVLCEVPLSPPQAAKGASIKIKTLKGGKAVLRIPPGTVDGAVFRLRNMGIEQNGRRGNQMVTVRVGGESEAREARGSKRRSSRPRQTDKPRA